MHSKAVPSKRLKASATSSTGEADPSSLVCNRWVGQAEGPFALSKGTTAKEVFGAAGALRKLYSQGGRQIAKMKK